MTGVVRFLKRTDAPLYYQIISVLVAGILGSVITYATISHTNEKNREAQAFIEEIRSFEASTNEFSTLFNRLALKIMTSKNIDRVKIDETQRVQIINNLGSQYRKIKTLEGYLPQNQRQLATRYEQQLFRVRNSIRKAQGFDDLGDSYQEIAKLFLRQKELIETLRKKAGMAPRNDS